MNRLNEDDSVSNIGNYAKGGGATVFAPVININIVVSNPEDMASLMDLLHEMTNSQNALDAPRRHELMGRIKMMLSPTTDAVEAQARND